MANLRKIHKALRKHGGKLLRNKNHEIWQMPDGEQIQISKSWNSPKLHQFEQWKKRNGIK